MKKYILVILTTIFINQIFAIGGFGLHIDQGNYSIGETSTDLKVANVNIGRITHHGFTNGYGIGGYLYLDAIPIVDIDLEALMNFSPYKFSFQNQSTENRIDREQFGWTDFSMYATLQKKILKLSIPFFAKAKLSTCAGLNTHSSIPMIDQPMLEAVMSSENISEGTLDTNELIEYLKNNMVSSTGFHIQSGVQFKILMFDSFLYYRYVFAKDLLPGLSSFSSLNLRVGLGF